MEGFDAGVRGDGSGYRRRDVLKAGAAGVFALSAANILAACGGGGGTGGTGATGSQFSSGPVAGGKPAIGGTLRVGLVSAGSAETMSPLTAVANPDIVRVYALFDPLFKSVAGGKFAPGLAEEGSSNANATRWKLKLRKGVTWHDGKPFTADDVVYSVKSSWGSSKNAIYPAIAPLIDFKNARKLDTYTVEIPLFQGMAEFPQMTSGWPFLILQEGTTDFNNPVGTGPFAFKSFEPGVNSVFTANKSYWVSGVPYVDELEVNSSFAEDTARFNSLLAGEIDIAPQVPQALAQANSTSGRIVLGNQPAPGFLAPTMHVDDAPYSDVRVRQALRLLADRKAAVKTVVDGFGTVGNDCPGQTLQYWASDLHREYDPEKAKSLLKAAGQEDLSVTLYSAPVVPGVDEAAILYANQAKAGSVSVNVKRVDAATYYSPASPGGGYPTKPFSVNQWSTGMPCLSFVYLTALVTEAPYWETGWGSKSEDKVLYEAVAESNPSRAEEKWHAVQQMQFDEGGYIIMLNITNLDGYGTNVRGVKTTSAAPCDNYNFSEGWLAQ